MPNFKTRAGRIIYRGQVPSIFCYKKAVKKAALAGVDTLIVEEGGRELDYTLQLRRYYEENSLTPAA